MSLQAMKQALDLLQKLQWSDHHYDPAHGHSYMCPICGGCGRHGDLRSVTSFYGHSKTCRFATVGKELWQAVEQAKEAQPLSYDQVKSEFSKHYPKDLPLIELAEDSQDFSMAVIRAYHHLMAFDLGVKAAEQAHGIK